MAVAIAISATQGSQISATLKPGEQMTIGGYTLTYRELGTAPLPDDARVFEARALVDFSGPQTGTLATALRDYPNSDTLIATPAVRTSLGEDLYVTLIGYDGTSKTATFRVFINPGVAWIWLGGGMVGLAAIFAIWPERRRVPAATPADAPADAPADGPAPAPSAPAEAQG